MILAQKTLRSWARTGVIAVGRQGDVGLVNISDSRHMSCVSRLWSPRLYDEVSSSMRPVAWLSARLTGQALRRGL
jgi:hypothetical protein